MDCEPGYHRGRMCYERQIDAQAERLEWTEEQLELCKDLRIEIEWLNEKFEACQKRYAGLLREYLKRMGFPNNEINKEIENELKDLGKI
jgi:Mg2+ and Co2+ transporter CorA